MDETLCEPRVVMLQPSVFGAGYFPRRAYGPMVGGGLEIVWLSWTSNTNTFGPSHGKLRSSVMELFATRATERTLMWTTGAVVSVEKNPSRRVLIPYFGPTIGGVLPSFGDHRMFVDGTLGAYLYHDPSFSIAAEGAYMLVFSASDALSGPRAQLNVAFSLW